VGQLTRTSTSTRYNHEPLSEQALSIHRRAQRRSHGFGGTQRPGCEDRPAGGQTARRRPQVHATTGVVNSTTDPLTQSFGGSSDHQQDDLSHRAPRLQLTMNHRSRGRSRRTTWFPIPLHQQRADRLPGFSGAWFADSTPVLRQGSWRGRYRADFVNEFRFGRPAARPSFLPTSPRYVPGHRIWRYERLRHRVEWVQSIANPYPSSANSSREGKTMVFEDNLSWVKGPHLLSMGVSYTKAKYGFNNQTKAPVLTLGMTSSGDPADSMFVTANFPNASSIGHHHAEPHAVLTAPRQRHHAQRTHPAGRLKPIRSSAPAISMERCGVGSFINDSWRVKPTLTSTPGSAMTCSGLSMRRTHYSTPPRRHLRRHWSGQRLSSRDRW